MNWKPIVEDERRDVYEDMIFKIRKSIVDSVYDEDMKSLDIMYGYSGFVLLFSYLYKLKNQEPELEEMIEHSLLKFMNSEHNNFALGTGINGPKWLFQHQINEEILELDLDEVFDNLEDSNFNLGLLNDGNYDYLIGGLSDLLFNISANNRAEISKIIKVLLNSMQQYENIRLWKFYNTIEGVKPDATVFNLGLGHGIPGLVLLLGIASEYCIDINLKLKIETTIRDLLNWMISFRIHDGKSFYPEFIEYPYEANDNQSYLRWCYGDMGIAFSFYLSGKRYNSKDWETEGINIMLNAVSRLDAELEDIWEAHLCHGTAGLGHMFNRFFQYTEIYEFKEAAIKCFDKTIGKAVIDENGYPRFYALKGDFGKVPFGGLLEGASGIALTLLSAISDIEPKWDRLFLLS